MTIITAAGRMRTLEDTVMGVGTSACGIADALHEARDDLESQIHRLIKDGADSLDVDERAAKVKALDDTLVVLDVLISTSTLYVRQSGDLIDTLLEVSQ